MRLGKRVARPLWLAAAIAVGWACGGSSELGTVCSPGSTRVCSGSGACAGAQVCNDDGSAWGACDCGDGTGGSAGAPQGEGGADRVCLPGHMQICTGPDDCAGVRVCNQDGTAYGACECDGETAGGGTGGIIIIVPTGGTGAQAARAACRSPLSVRSAVTETSIRHVRNAMTATSCPVTGATGSV